MTKRTCDAEGCDKPARSGAAAWCKMHYHRLYRHGSLDKTAARTDVTASSGRRYRSAYQPDHPLATKNGKVYEHRAALFDAIGVGPHPCHWCAVPVDWLPRGHEHELQVDHLNGVGDDNRAVNIVPSCRRCNATRAAQARSAALRDAGWWSNHDTIAALHGRQRRSPVVAQGASQQFALFG